VVFIIFSADNRYRRLNTLSGKQIRRRVIMMSVFVYPNGIIFLAVKLIVLMVVLLLWLNATSLPLA
jgi:hypothetical protein